MVQGLPDPVCGSQVCKLRHFAGMLHITEHRVISLELMERRDFHVRCTLLISWRSLSVISVFLGFSICPITAMMSCPPAGLALAASRSCSVTSCVCIRTSL